MCTKQAPGFEKIDKAANRPLVMKVRKSLYGLRQYPSVWNGTTDKDLQTMDFPSIVSDPCVYTKRIGNNCTRPTLFVDDLLITGPPNVSVADVQNMLLVRFAMTDLGDATQFLEIRVKRNKEAGIIEASTQSRCSSPSA